MMIMILNNTHTKDSNNSNTSNNSSNNKRHNNDDTPSPPIKSSDFRGFDSSRLFILRGEFSCPLNLIGGLPESLT